jgi:hypothetical protein
LHFSFDVCGSFHDLILYILGGITELVYGLAHRLRQARYSFGPKEEKVNKKNQYDFARTHVTKIRGLLQAPFIF